MGRPPKLDEDLVRRFGVAVAIGARPEQVARSLGVGRSTYYEWIKRGVAPGPGDHLYVDFVATIDRARGSAYVSLIADLRKIAQRDPRAAIKLLETIDKEWGSAGSGGASTATAPIINFVISRKDGKGSEDSDESGVPSQAQVVFDVGPQEPSDRSNDAAPEGDAGPPDTMRTRVVIDVAARRGPTSEAIAS